MGIRRHQQGPGASLQGRRPGNPLGSTRSVGSPGASSAPPRRARRMRASPLHSGRKRPHHLDISCQADVVRKCMMLSAHLDSTGLTAELGDVTFCISYSGKKAKVQALSPGRRPWLPKPDRVEWCSRRRSSHGTILGVFQPSRTAPSWRKESLRPGLHFPRLEKQTKPSKSQS